MMMVVELRQGSSEQYNPACMLMLVCGAKVDMTKMASPQCTTVVGFAFFIDDARHQTEELSFLDPHTTCGCSVRPVLGCFPSDQSLVPA